MTPTLRHPGRVLLLVACATAANFVRIPLPGELQLLLGPFLYMPLVLLLPLPWAILAAAIPSAATIFTLDQPFVFLIAIAEATWLGLAQQKWRRSSVLQDVLFWIVATVPLHSGLYYHLAHLPADLVVLVALKQILNQCSAVVFAVLLLRHTRLSVWLDDRSVPRRRMRDAVLHAALLLALAPLVTAGIGVSVLLRAYASREDAEVLQATAGRRAQQLGLFLDLHSASMTSLAGSLSRSGGDPAVLLAEAHRAHPAFITMLATDASGRIIASAPARESPAQSSLSVADREYFRAARDLDRVFISGVFRGRGFGRDILVAVSAPWHDANGNFAGVVEGSLEVHKFARLISAGQVDDDVTLVYGDRTGRVIFAEEEAGISPLSSLRHTPQGEFLAHPDPNHRVRFDQSNADGSLTRVVAYSCRAAGSGAIVIAQRPLLTGFAGSGWIFGLFGVVVLGTLAVAVLVMHNTRRKVAEPLEHFAIATSRQKESQTVEPIENPFENELHEVWIVFRAFNELAAQLQVSWTQLRQTNVDLDRRVAERTREVETARQEAVRANQSKTDFLAMTGHEIRTPLNAILGHTEVLFEATPDAPTRERLNTIRTAGQRLLRILNDLLDLSKIEAGRFELHSSPADVRELCAEVVTLFAAQAERAGLRLEFACARETPLWAQCDGIRLQQVLSNLVGNALKFTPAGRVRVTLTELDATPACLTLRFGVSDTGPGVTPEQRARLFQPYSQLESGGTSGTGLGLAISRQLVKLMGSDIELQSEAERGSEFFFDLVLPPASPPAPPPPVIPRAPAAWAPRVLVVDDNFVNQEVVRSFLEGRCGSLEIVDSASAALSALASQPFDVALIDLEMPDADGYSVARTIRAGDAAQPSHGCRLIACSAHARTEVWRKCAEAGFDDYIEKPISRRVLLEAVLEPVPAAATV